MSHSAAVALVLFLYTLISGCASVMPERDQLGSAGRYAELATHVEQETAGKAEFKTAQLFHLCSAYSKLKRYNKLFPCLDQLEENFKKGDTAPIDMTELMERNPLAGAWVNFSISLVGGKDAINVTPAASLMRAEAYLELSEGEKAISEAKRAVERTAKLTFSRGAEIEALGLVGLAYSLGGDRANALKTAEKLDAIYTGYPFIGFAPEKHLRLARIHMSLGDYRKTLALMQKTYPLWEITKVMGNVTGVLIATTNAEADLFAFQELPRQFMLAKAHLEVGHVAEAKTRYDALLQHPHTMQNGEIYWMILFDRGRIAEQEGDYRGAIEYYRRAIGIVEAQRASINTESSKIGFVGNKQAVYGQLVDALLREGRQAEAFEFVERAKSRALVDMLAAKQDFLVQAANAEGVHALLRQASEAEAEARVQDVAATQSQVRTLKVDPRRELQDQAPELASLVSVTALATADIQERIAPDETLIEYYYSDGKKLYAFVVTRSGLRAQELDGAGLAEAVHSFRRLIQNPASDAYLAAAQQLYARLMQPLESMLDGGRLTIVAHGALHYLPFNALHDGKRFTVERFALRMLPAASVVKFLKRPAADKPGELLAFGNPDLGDPRYSLDFAQLEAEGVAAVAPRSRALVRGGATETAFKQFSNDFRFLHIASHGEFNPDAPLKSALLLARDSQNDGVLTVGELYSMRVSADLVTLSACETGLAKIANGDDLVGLTRGFLYSGASSIVASLWQVDDRATGQLMAAFYEALRSGADKRESLRRAQLATMKAYPHPFFWAAFQLTGNS